MRKYLKILKNGFTLIELLSVIVILAIVLAISIPSISSIISTATKNAFEADTKMIIKAIELERLQNDTFDPTQITEENIEDLLNISNDNYDSITITDDNGNIEVIVIGKNRWDDLVAHGDEDNIEVEGTDTYELVAPVITIIGANPASIVVGGTYNDAGATALDDIDGDLTDSIVITSTVNPNTVGVYTVEYNVTDSNGNPAVPAIRTVYVVDATAPVITMLGSSPVQINKGDTYSDAGATALDDIDGDITDNIVTTSTVSPNVPGTYTVTYNVSDSAGNAAAPVVRTVVVLDVTAPTITLGDTPVSYVISNGATISGNVTSDGNSVVIERGVVYGTSTNPTISGNKKVVSGTTGTFTTNLTGLASGTTYYARVYATNSAGTSYSNEINFTTPAIIADMYGGSSGSSGDPEGFWGVTTANDGYVAAGLAWSTDGDLVGLTKGDADGSLVKYDTNGNLVWKKSFGGSGTPGYTWFESVAYAPDGGYIVSGFSTSSGGDLSGLHIDGHDAIMVKYNSSGSVVWKDVFGGTWADVFMDAIPVSDGYIAVGESSSSDYDMSGLQYGNDCSDAIIVKYNTSGGVVWKRHYGGLNQDQFRAATATVAGDGYVVVGYSNSNDNDVAGMNKGSYDGIIVKYNTSGSIIWKKNFGGSGYDNLDDIIAVDDGYIIVGKSPSNDGDLAGLNKGGDDGLIIKLDLNGNVVWKKTYGGSSSDSFYGGILNSGSGYIVGGTSSSSNGDLTDLNKGGSDGIVVKFDTNGNVLWKTNYGGTGEDNFSAISPTSNGFIVVGYSSSNDGDYAGLNNGGYDSSFIIGE